MDKKCVKTNIQQILKKKTCFLYDPTGRVLSEVGPFQLFHAVMKVSTSQIRGIPPPGK